MEAHSWLPQYSAKCTDEKWNPQSPTSWYIYLQTYMQINIPSFSILMAYKNSYVANTWRKAFQISK